jgi:hypothetical protein
MVQGECHGSGDERPPAGPVKRGPLRVVNRNGLVLRASRSVGHCGAPLRVIWLAVAPCLRRAFSGFGESCDRDGPGIRRWHPADPGKAVPGAFRAADLVGVYEECPVADL